MEDTRQLIESFASSHMKVDSLEPMTADASFRSYWRLISNGQSYVVMDSPPELVDMKPFIELGLWLAEAGIPVPDILHVDPNFRFMILEDLGQDNLFSRLNQTPDIHLLEKPIGVLKDLAKLSKTEFLPEFKHETLISETALFDDWCLAKLNVDAQPGDFDGLYKLLADAALDQPQCFVHRDYHSYNIHFSDKKKSGVALIDFQDGLWGPATYDLVSILFDRYITWSDEQAFDAIEQYRQLAKVNTSPLEFRRQALLVSLQRNIRILGVFHRLKMRDGKAIYMDYVPRFAHYCLRVLKHYSDLKEYSGMIECFDQAGWT